MDRARQDTLQDWINEARRLGIITPLCRDFAEAMVWKCRKRDDGSFMAGYKALAGMARGCRDSAIQAVSVLQRVGFLAKERTRVWCAALHKWVQGKNVYRLIAPGFSESENPTPDSSKNPDSFLLEKEVAHEREAADAQHDPAVEPEMGALSPDGTGTRGLADGGESQRPAESRSGRVGGTGVWPGPTGPARLFTEGMMTLAAVLAERQRKIAQGWRDGRAGATVAVTQALRGHQSLSDESS
jgi:hypothetical protein